MPLSHTVEMLGVLGTSSYLAARLARASRLAGFHRYAILAQPRASLPVMPRGYRVEVLDPAALAGHTVDADPATQARRFAAGLTCLGVFEPRSALTGVVWLGAGSYHEDEVAVRFQLPTRCCWDTGLWIEPSRRMGRSFAALWAGVGAWMEGHGFSHSLSRIADYNLPALTAHRRMGGTVLAHHSFVRLGRWQWSRTSRPRLVRLAPAAPPPVLDLTALLDGLD
ncbi:hypothetical protein ACFOON_03930 [Novosphingobium piscinae]|uniref:N-acetyltransferase domain-containing protein n=1 Tax=Novosphingobium piscinae TaxID=1507448 RepID=A0A7X1G061_9SPHN|nr:hypothetical protein [Novosphingobium piscinae]MBC2670233.1 hypothetical protein [Novosphingobium piscinae]